MAADGTLCSCRSLVCAWDMLWCWYVRGGVMRFAPSAIMAISSPYRLEAAVNLACGDHYPIPYP